MTLVELKYVVAVAQEGHFGRAADRCGVTQPALSLAIRKFEEELGVRLFERRRQGAVVTSLGAKVVHQAQHVLEAADQIVGLVAEGKDQLVGVFRLGVIATVGPYLLPDLISALHRRAPSMPLEIEENVTANLNVMLKQGALDAMIVALPHDEAGMLSQPLYVEPFEVVVPVTHAWATREHIDVEELGKEKVLLPHAGHCFRRQVLDQCPDVSRSDREGVQGNSLETIRQMVASGLGITVLPCSALTAKHRHKRLVSVPFTDPTPERRIGLVWRKGFGRPRALEVLGETVRSVKIGGVEMVSMTERARGRGKA